jgi:tRNA (guanine37-N1)-methyltransferase
VRQALIAEEALDRALKPRREGDALLLPLVRRKDGAIREYFDPVPGRAELPRHELIGGIAVMQERDPDGAALILASRRNLHTVLFPTSEVGGEYRTKSFEVLAGEQTTRTEVTEHGYRFEVDLSAAYFSARLATERRRIAAMAGGGEAILDMFAGVGPFAITLSRTAAVVVAADINPRAVGLMLSNCARNRASNVLPVLADARHLAGIIPWKSDRIVMNLPKSGEAFLPDAFLLCRPGGTIHFYALVSAEGEHRARIEDLGGKVVAERVVRSYSPAQWHAVYDIRVV